MKVWTSEHTFNHPWDTVVSAAWRKYPNPLNFAVVGIDVIDRQVESGVLKTHRIFKTKWDLPWGASNVFGSTSKFYASEHSEVDATNKTMTLISHNLNFLDKLYILEKLTYSPHPSDPNSTLLKQESVVTVKSLPLANYVEDFISRTISSNANKGRQAMEWVINKLNLEVQEMKQSAAKSMDELSKLSLKDAQTVTFQS